MVLGFTDRTSFQTGYNQWGPKTTDPEDSSHTYQYDAAGDILRVCNTNGTYELEGTGSCPQNPANNNNSIDEFFGGEYYNGVHSETALGGLLHKQGSSVVGTTAYDMLNKNDGEYDRSGSKFLDMTDGSEKGGQLLNGKGTTKPGTAAGFSKSGGMGDIEILSDPAPIEIGNYVWDDTNGNGVQDPDEPALEGVKVKLYEGTKLRGTATTDADGHYYFGGPDDTNAHVKPNTAYQLRIDLADPKLDGKPATQKDATADNADSDGDNGELNPGFSTIAYTTGNAGQNNHDLDFGFGKNVVVSIGSIVWNDVNKNGLQDQGEAGIKGATVTLLHEDGTPVNGVDSQPTDSNGRYYFGDLPEDTYRVKVVPPAEYVKSPIQNTTDEGEAEHDNPNDSNIQSSNNNEHISGKFLLEDNGEPSGAAEKSPLDNNGDDADDAEDSNGNMTVDFAFYKPVSIGSVVWDDINHNGKQDKGEAGIQGATVTLLHEDGTALDGVDSQITDSNGQYYFDYLAEGTYIVKVVPPAGYVKSPIQNGTEGDLDNDSDINKTEGNAHFSHSYTLTVNGEPTGESSQIDGSSDNADKDGGSGQAGDNSGNMTVDFGFYKPKVSIGNVVWLDNGAGAGTKDNGIMDGAEKGIAGVTVELYKKGETPATTAATATTTTESDGTYVFNDLDEGNYFVHIPVSEFAAGKPLENMNSSTDQGTSTTDDDDTDENGDDNTADGVSSIDYDLKNNQAPTGEAGFNGIAQSTEDDDNTNMTVDFGFYPKEPSIEISKTVNGPAVKNADGTYTVVYTVEAKNTSEVEGTYDLIESIEPGTGITVNTTTKPTIEYLGAPDGGEADGTNGTLTGNDFSTGSVSVLTNETLAAGATETWKVTVVYDVDHNAVNNANSATCSDTSDAKGDGGFANVIDTSYENDLETNDEACVPLIQKVSIGSTVFKDLNNDGKQSGAGETGIAGLTVTLYAEDGKTVIATTTTDNDGNYFFDELSEGKYVVGVTPNADIHFQVQI